MQEYLPELATLRRFAERIYWLFDTPKDYHQASCRRAVIVRDPAFQAVPELNKALEQLSAEKFPKIMAYLNNPVSRRVRTRPSRRANQPDGSGSRRRSGYQVASANAGPVRGVGCVGRHLGLLLVPSRPGRRNSKAGRRRNAQAPTRRVSPVESRENGVVFQREVSFFSTVAGVEFERLTRDWPISSLVADFDSSSRDAILS